MTQGESSSEKAKLDILMLAADRKEHKSSDFVQGLKGKYAKNTVYKYLKELVNDGLMEKKPGSREESFRPRYFIPEKAKNKVDKLLLRNDIYDIVDSFDTKWLEMLRRFLDGLRKEGDDPKEFFNRYCLAFIRGIPYNFEKSMEGMKNVLLFERHLEKLAAKKGVTKDEYFKEMVKYVTAQPKGMRRILAYLKYMGLTEEDIEKLRERQGGTFKVTRYTRKNG